MHDLEYFSGVRASGGIPTPRPVRVLCYHSISDRKGAREFFGAPPRWFRFQAKLALAAPRTPRVGSTEQPVTSFRAAGEYDLAPKRGAAIAGLAGAPTTKPEIRQVDGEPAIPRIEIFLDDRVVRSVWSVAIGRCVPAAARGASCAAAGLWLVSPRPAGADRASR